MMYTLMLFGISLLPVVLIGMYIYEKTKSKNSMNLLLKLFFGGCASTGLVIAVSSILEIFIPMLAIPIDKMTTIQLLIKFFIGVALIEECAKWIVAYLISYKSKEFDHIYNIIIYSVFSSLGFAFFENLLYVYSNGFMTGILRAITAVPLHACCGVFMGYYLGLTKLSERNNNKRLYRKNISLSIIVPMIIHGYYDFCLTSGNAKLMISLIIIIIILYIIAAIKLNMFSKVESKLQYKTNYCPRCGIKLDNNFCPNCGIKRE